MDSLVVPYRKSLAVVLVSALVFLLAMLLNPTPLTLLPNILNASNPIVKDARSGISYRGTYSNGIEQFQNIYYAQDTSGQNRFAPPAPLKPSPGTIIDATASGAWCPQGVGGPPLPWTSAITNVSENCLSLRIARPSKTDHGARLPVLVWMHGGKTITYLERYRKNGDMRALAQPTATISGLVLASKTGKLLLLLIWTVYRGRCTW